jgi:uncharacterized protein (DUF58 family)
MTSELVERVRRLEITVAGRVEGLLQGDHRGLLPGPGSERGDARPYVPGDDVRRIDWNVTARTRRPHVRDTTADHELETTLVIDASPSMTFGTTGGTKLEVAQTAAAVFGFVTNGAGDRVGAIIVAARRLVIPPAGGRAQVYRILRATETAGDGQGDLALALRHTLRMRRRRGLVVVVSDFLDAGAWERPLRGLAGKHEVVAVEVTDPREFELVDVGVVRMCDPETGRIAWVDTSDRRFRARYSAEAARRSAEVAGRLRSAGARHLRLSTGRDWVGDLVREVLDRRRLLAASGRTS